MKEKYKRDMRRPGFLNKENNSDLKMLHFLKIAVFSFNVFDL